MADSAGASQKNFSSVHDHIVIFKKKFAVISYDFVKELILVKWRILGWKEYTQSQKSNGGCIKSFQ